MTIYSSLYFNEVSQQDKSLVLQVDKRTDAEFLMFS